VVCLLCAILKMAASVCLLLSGGKTQNKRCCNLSTERERERQPPFCQAEFYSTFNPLSSQSHPLATCPIALVTALWQLPFQRYIADVAGTCDSTLCMGVCLSVCILLCVCVNPTKPKPKLPSKTQRKK